MRVFAVDPGAVTGFASWQDGMLHHVEQKPHEEFVRWATTHIMFEWADVIVCEDFKVTIHTVRKTWQPYSLHQIGWLKYEAIAAGTGFALQTPADAKGFASDNKLKALGWYTPTPGGHVNDALRHLMLYLVRVNELDLEPLLGVD